MAAAAERTESWTPAMDISETGEGFCVRLDLAGVAREDMEVMVSEQALVISGLRRLPEPEGLALSRREREYGRFRRTVELPAGADRGALSAALRDGVLEVRVGKRAGEMPKRVEIKAAAQEEPPSAGVGSSEDGK